MVRKATAVEVNKNKIDDTGINIDKFLNDSRQGAKENAHLLVGVVFLLRGLIILREFLVGMILVTSGILFIS